MSLAALVAAALVAAPSAPAPAASPAGPAARPATAPAPAAAEVGFAPAKEDKCPVCGMFVAKYPDWVAGATLRDGTRLVFDGPKDMLKFWFDPARFLPDRRRDDVAAVFVTDYYGLKRVDAHAALYVLGGDVLGPMGRELVPFARREDADEFARDHHGTRILRFDEITPDLVRSLDV